MNHKYCLIALLFIAAMTISLTGSGQTKVFEYNYDASGNRIERQLIQLKSATINSSNNETQKQEEFDAMLGEQEIKIYPNPTKGSLRVSIPIKEYQQNVILQVYSMQGALIIDRRVTGEMTVVDLNRHPSGIYILRISSGQSVSEWKIMKE